MSNQKMLKLKSRDNQEFMVEESIAKGSPTLKKLIDNNGSPVDVINLNNVEGSTLAKVLEFMKKHADETMTESELKRFDDGLLNIGWEELLCLMIVAHYLNLPELVEKCCSKMANLGKEFAETHVPGFIDKCCSDLADFLNKNNNNGSAGGGPNSPWMGF